METRAIQTPPFETAEFLRQLCSSEPFLEVRYIHHDRKAAKTVDQRFYSSISELDWAEVNKRNEKGFNAYFGPGRRVGRDGSKDGVSEILAIWADLDAKDFNPKDLSTGVLLAMDRVHTLPVDRWPSVVVESGNGYHLYWLLREPLNTTTRAGRERAEAIMRGLAKHLGGDHTHDIGRVMRLPGSLNVKDPGDPKPCKIVMANYDRRFSPNDFEHWAIYETKAAPKETELGVGGPALYIEGLRISPEMKALVVGGGPSTYKSRSEADQAVITALLNGSHTAGEIREVFSNLSWRIGERYRQVDQGNPYLDRCISAAAAFIAANPSTICDNGRTEAARSTATAETKEEKWLTHPISHLAKTTTESRRFLVDSLFAENKFGFLGGLPKVLKSWLALEIARCVASGTDLFGHFQVARPAKVMFIEEEDDEMTLRERLSALSKGADAPLPPDENFRYATMTGLRIDPSNSSVNPQFGLLQSDIDRIRPDLLIVDNLNRVHTGDENLQKDMTRVMQVFEAIRRQYGCAILIVHHHSKPSKEKRGRRGIESLRGSSVLPSWDENGLNIMSRDREDTLRIEPSGKFKPLKPFMIRLESIPEGERGGGGLRFIYVGDTSAVKKSDPKEKVYRAIVDALAADPSDLEARTKSGLAKHLNMAESTVRSHLTALEGDGRLESTNDKIDGKGQARDIYTPTKERATNHA